jgi:hypothetical protein
MAKKPASKQPISKAEATSNRAEREAKRPTHTEAKSSFWDNLPSLTQHLICGGMILLVGIVFFSALLFGGKSLVGSDSVQARGMAKSVLEYEAQTGEQALWATNAFSGMPAYSISYPNAVPQLDSVVRTLNKALPFPFVPFLVLAFGMYFLAYYLTKDKLLGLFAAFTYSLTNYLPMILIAGHNTKYSTLAYTPWLILAFVHVLRKPNLLSGLLFAAALALNLRANHPQITYYVLILLAIWWIAEAVSAFRKGEGKSFGFATALLVLGLVAALAMVAQPFWVLQEYKQYSIRGASEGGGSGAMDWTYAMAWSQGIGEMWTLLIPDAYGGGGQTYWGDKSLTFGPHYIGGIVILLAILALWRVRSKMVWGLGIGTAFTIFFALGKNFPALNEVMYNYFPLFNSFRVPETWLIISVLGLVILAVFGLQYAFAQDQNAEVSQVHSRSIFVTIGAMLGLVLILMLGKSAFFAFEKPDEVSQIAQMITQQSRGQVAGAEARTQAAQYIAQNKPERETLFQSDVQRTLLFLALAAALLVLYRFRKIPAFAAKLGIAILALVDVWGVATRYFNNEYLKDKTDVDQEAASQATEADVWLQSKVKESGGLGHFRVLPLTKSPFQDGTSSYFFESLGGYSGAKLRNYQDFIDNILTNKQGEINPNALDMMATKYVIANGLLPDSKPVYVNADTSQIVLERTHPTPRAWFVGNTEVVKDAKTTWGKLWSPGFKAHQTALVTQELNLKPAPMDSLGQAASVQLKSFSPNKIVWQAKTDATRLLVASEVYYPAGWQAFVDGKETPIYQTDYVLRGVVVPSGSHTVEMRFEPARHASSVTISWIATILVYGGILAFFGLAWMQNKKDTENAEEKNEA